MSAISRSPCTFSGTRAVACTSCLTLPFCRNVSGSQQLVRHRKLSTVFVSGSFYISWRHFLYQLEFFLTSKTLQRRDISWTLFIARSSDFVIRVRLRNSTNQHLHPSFCRCNPRTRPRQPEPASLLVPCGRSKREKRMRCTDVRTLWSTAPTAGARPPLESGSLPTFFGRRDRLVWFLSETNEVVCLLKGQRKRIVYTIIEVFIFKVCLLSFFLLFCERRRFRSKDRADSYRTTAVCRRFSSKSQAGPSLRLTGQSCRLASSSIVFRAQRISSAPTMDFILFWMIERQNTILQSIPSTLPAKANAFLRESLVSSVLCASLLIVRWNLEHFPALDHLPSRKRQTHRM